jgi:hypothetical protein
MGLTEQSSAYVISKYLQSLVFGNCLKTARKQMRVTQNPVSPGKSNPENKPALAIPCRVAGRCMQLFDDLLTICGQTGLELC